MSLIPMLLVSLIYLWAAVAFALERKWPYAIGVLCWAIGNLAFAYAGNKDQVIATLRAWL